jgi:hypothetical protein
MLYVLSGEAKQAQASTPWPLPQSFQGWRVVKTLSSCWLGQREAKRQPVGMSRRLGTMPGMTGRSVFGG